LKSISEWEITDELCGRDVTMKLLQSTPGPSWTF